jgi:hypothetical protein
MKRRIRTLAGTFGLAAMALSLGEAVLASVCATSMDMASVGVDGAQVSEAMKDMPGMPMPADGPEDDPGSRYDECPLGPALGQGCLALALLPANGPLSGDALPDAFGRSAADSLRPDLLLAHALFRPPRA